jgi:nitroreductase
MEFSKLIQKRRSVRAFTSQEVEVEKIEKILEASNSAPSAGNLQAYEIFVVRKPSLRVELAKASLNQEFIAEAPVNLVFCTHSERSEGRYLQRGARLYALQDATIACTFAMLAAVDMGLACVWVGAFDEEAVHRLIEAPMNIRPISILPIGYADGSPSISSRRQLNDIVHWL